MQWWAWIVVGAILLGSELAFVNAQFYLVFVGAAALVVGFLMVSGLDLAVWLQWLVFALLAAVSMFGFRRRIYERLRRDLPKMRGGLVGESVIVPVALQPGDTCRMEVRGSSWSATNGGDAPITAGAEARIERIEALTLILRSH